MKPELVLAAAFFAKLANKQPDEDFDEEELTTLGAECRRVCEAMHYPLNPQTIENLNDLDEPFWFDERRDEEAWSSYLGGVVRRLWLDPVQPDLAMLFEGGSITLQTSIVLSLEGRTTVERALSLQHEISLPPEEFLRALFYDLLRSRPFPFGRCPVCKKIFVQTSPRKPIKYCSAACKQRGIPSAATHAADMRIRRQQARAKEIKKTRDIVKQWPDPQEHLPRLRKELRKSRRQVLYLIKQAKQGAQGRTKEA